MRGLALNAFFICADAGSGPGVGGDQPFGACPAAAALIKVKI